MSKPEYQPNAKVNNTNLMGVNMWKEAREFENPYTGEVMYTNDPKVMLQWKDAYKMDWQEEDLSQEMQNRTPSSAARFDDRYYSTVNWLNERWDYLVEELGQTENAKWINDRLLQLEEERLAQFIYPYASGHADQTESGNTADINTYEEYRNAHLRYEQSANSPVKVGKWVDWSLHRQSQARHLHRILFHLNCKLDRAQTWDQAMDAIQWALNENRGKKSDVYYSVDATGKKSFFLTNKSGKLKPLYISCSSPAGYKNNLTIRAFVMCKHLEYGEERAHRIANMWRTRNGKVAMDYQQKQWPANNRYGASADEMIDRMLEHKDLFIHLLD